MASTHGAALPPSVTTTLRAAGNGAQADFNTSVFVNCPFDNEFLQLLHALLFAIHDCGFVARYAVQDAGAAELRIDKICYASFLAALPSIAAGMEISSEEIQSFDYRTDWVQTMSQWVLQK